MEDDFIRVVQDLANQNAKLLDILHKLVDLIDGLDPEDDGQEALVVGIQKKVEELTSKFT